MTPGNITWEGETHESLHSNPKETTPSHPTPSPPNEVDVDFFY